MPDQEREAVRRILEALLAKLDGGPRDRDERASSILLSEGTDPASPVIVVLGGMNPQTQDAVERRQPRFDEIGLSATANVSAAAHANPQASHPGLERFPLAEPQSHPSAPKACFMEPGRACINSGACEMRGY